MRLEGTLDACGAADLLHLLAGTGKTGTLHLLRPGRHATVSLRDGALTGARGRAGRQELARRLLGAGLVDDLLLARVAAAGPAPSGLGRRLAEAGGLDPSGVAGLVAEQAVDALVDVLCWPDGDFRFAAGEPDPDDVGTPLPVDQVLAEAERRLAARAGVATAAPAAVVQVAPSPPPAPVHLPEAWWLLRLVDGRRTVAELVDVSGRGDHAVDAALAALSQAGVVVVLDPGSAPAPSRRAELLAALEAPVAADPDPATGPRRTVSAPAPAPAPAPRAAPDAPAASSGGVGEPAPSEADRQLLLRLIAGVRGL